MQPSARILLGDGNHQPEVCLRQLVLCLLVPFGHPFGKLNFLVGGQKLYLADLLQIHPDRVIQAVFRRQIHGVNQFFLFQAGQIDVSIHVQTQVIVTQIQFQVRRDHLDVHVVQPVINFLDLLRGQLHFFQLGIQVCGPDDAFLLALGNQVL